MLSVHEPVGMAVVGYGYWGPNIVRNVLELPELELHALCELDPERSRVFERRHPEIPVERDLDAVLADPRVEAVAIATPPRTHHALVSRALAAGKHVLVEKPLATNSVNARELVEAAERSELVLMPGHTFLYSPAVNKVRELITSGELGEVYFVTSSRMNLGMYQSDGVVCDLAPHDMSILLYWLDQPISVVAASGCTVFQNGVPETAFLTLCFERGPTANVQVSWLAPSKVRQMIVVGSKRMVQYDDTASDEPVRIYDRGFDFTEPTTFGEYQLTYRSGDVVVPRVEPAEPLALELQDFAGSIREGRAPRSHAGLGLEIVRALEAANTSLAASGAPVVLDSGLATGALPTSVNGNAANAIGGNGASADPLARHARRAGLAAAGDEPTSPPVPL